MKKLILFLSIICLSAEALASGCLSESFYNLEAVAKIAGAESCYVEKLEKIASPQSVADRQYNYFAEKINEYALVLDPKSIDSASLEFMFYPEVRKSFIANEDARKIDFSYVQTFKCYSQHEEKRINSQIFVFGIVGLTGVCLTKNKVSW